MRVGSFVVAIVLAGCATRAVEGTVGGELASFGAASGQFVDHPGFISVVVPRLGGADEQLSIHLPRGDCWRTPHDVHLERAAVSLSSSSGTTQYMKSGTFHVGFCDKHRLRATFTAVLDGDTRLRGFLDIPLEWTPGYD